MRYFYAVLWLAIFSGIGWYVYTGQAASYSGRRGRFLAEFLTSLSDSIGQGVTALLCVGIGVAFAAWSIWGKEDGDETASD